MPRLPTLRTRVLQELARQLRFESPDAARRQLGRAEDLALQLLTEEAEARAGGAPVAAAYPEDFVVFRITGLRVDPTKAGEDASGGVVVREALMGDLPALIDRLSAAAKLTTADFEAPVKPVKPGKAGSGGRAVGGVKRGGDPNAPLGPWLSVTELCARWKVSRKTLERYRRLGLISRRVTLGRGRERVVYAHAAASAFERVHRERVEEAGAFTRLDGRARERIIRRAGRYRKRLGWSLHRCAQRLAPREGRTVETIRQVLRRHDERAARPIFDEPAPMDSEQAAWVERTSRRGGKMSSAAGRVRKSRTTVYRAIGKRRAQRLRELDLRGPVGPMFARADAAEVLLSHAAARRGLGGTGASSIGALVREGAAIEPETAPHEAARAAAYWYLIWSAHRGVEALARHDARVRNGRGDGASLDAIETRLLWASRVKAEMVRSQLPLLLRVIETQTGLGSRTLTAIPAPALRELVLVGIEALIDAVERFDPFKGGRLAAPASLGLSRAVSRWLRSSGHAIAPAGAGRAAAKVDLNQLSLDDWTRRVHPWQAWLEPPVPAAGAPVRQRLGELAERERRVLEARFGWDGDPPRTLEAAARELGTTPTRIAAMQRRAVALLAFGPPPKAKGGRS